MKIVSKVSFLFAMSCMMLMASDKIKMINVEFHNSEDGGQDISMSLPISFLDSLKPQVEKALQELRDGKTEFDFAAMWKAIRDAGPNQFLEMDQEGHHIRVATTATHLNCTIQTEKNENISVSLPLALCDTLFDDPKALDFEKVMTALVAMEGQDLVNIDSETIKGRIWIQ